MVFIPSCKSAKSSSGKSFGSLCTRISSILKVAGFRTGELTRPASGSCFGGNISRYVVSICVWTEYPFFSVKLITAYSPSIVTTSAGVPLTKSMELPAAGIKTEIDSFIFASETPSANAAGRRPAIPMKETPSKIAAETRYFMGVQGLDSLGRIARDSALLPWSVALYIGYEFAHDLQNPFLGQLARRIIIVGLQIERQA